MAHINLKHFEWDDFYASSIWKCNTILALLIYIVFLSLPIHLFLMYRIRIKIGQDPEETESLNEDFINSHGELVEDFHLHRLGRAKVAFLVFAKFAYQYVPVLAFLELGATPVWAIFVCLLNEILYACLVFHFRPFKRNGWRFFYERVVYLVTIYHLPYFTEFTFTEQKIVAGLSVIFFISA
jgi:hypothetical protein